MTKAYAHEVTKKVGELYSFNIFNSFFADHINQTSSMTRIVNLNVQIELMCELIHEYLEKGNSREKNLAWIVNPKIIIEKLIYILDLSKKCGGDDLLLDAIETDIENMKKFFAARGRSRINREYRNVSHSASINNAFNPGSEFIARQLWQEFLTKRKEEIIVEETKEICIMFHDCILASVISDNPKINLANIVYLYEKIVTLKADVSWIGAKEPMIKAINNELRLFRNAISNGVGSIHDVYVVK